MDNAPSRRLIVEVLKQTRSRSNASVEVLATHARCPRDFAVEILTRLNINQEKGQISLSKGKRLDLALRTAWAGSLAEAGKYLDWREFEEFAEQCLWEMEYATMLDLRVKDQGRNWQIDLVGVKSPFVLCFDCKHWTTHSSPSRFKTAQEHQIRTTEIMVRRVGQERRERMLGLPIILTLLDPPASLSKDVVVLSVERLPSMIADLTPYSPGLPFLVAQEV